MSAGFTQEALFRLSSWLGDSCTKKHGCPLRNVSSLIRDYEVCKTVERLLDFSPTEDCNVALQFPDELLHHAPLVCEALKLQTEEALRERGAEQKFFYFVLGDTSYGECCVDEVAAAHLDAGVVVHYGNACLSPTRSLPALYIFPRADFEEPGRAVSNLKSAVTEILSHDEIKQLVLLYDTAIASCFQGDILRFGELSISLEDLAPNEIRVAALRSDAANSIVLPCNEETNVDKSRSCVGAHSFKQHDKSSASTGFLWLTRNTSSEEWPAAAYAAALQLCTGPTVRCAGLYVVSLTAESESTWSCVETSRLLRRRLAAFAAAKDAERIGIVPGTLGISGSADVIDRCKKVIKAVGKRAYVILVGKPNPPKLANFPEIDAFVLVACPQNALLDAKEYLRPLLTPLELEAVLLADGDIFSHPYSTDFRDLLAREVCILEDNEAISRGAEDETALAVRGDWSVSVTGDGAAAAYLKNRHWQGLSYSSGGRDDQEVVENLQVEAMPGQAGIASKYDFEIKDKT